MTRPWHSCVDSAPGKSRHGVQLYQSDEHLIDKLHEYAAEALSSENVCIVIATKAHRTALEDRLSHNGLYFPKARDHGRYLALDAAETLSSFMVDGTPHEDRFVEAIGGLIAQAAKAGKRVYAYGEMVALLWADGKHQSAIELEQFWNRLSERHSFSLLCAYPLAAFRGSANYDPLVAVCNEHSHVFPAEHEADSIGTIEPRAIAMLQQKAFSLDHEVEERKQVQRQLTQREAELADFLENGAIGLHQVGPDGMILWANKAELEMLGYDADEYIGHHIAEFHVDRPVIDELLERLLCGETLRDFPARLRCKGGSVNHVRIHSNALWEGDRFIHTRCFTRDVTEQKLAEDALRATQQRLEELVEERTAQLAASHEQLRHSERMASLGTFAAGIAHELNNPLNAVVLMAQYGIRANGSADHADIFGKIKDEAVRGGRIVKNVLKFARNERTSKSAGDVNEVVRHAAAVVGMYAGSSRLELIWDLATELPPVHLNPTDMEQVLVNLIKNAVEAAGGNVHVALRTFQSGDSVVITVSDNGPGMSDEVRKHIFDPFYTTKRRSGGSGLGLSLCHSIVADHEGALRVKSSPGNGTTFVISLPAIVPHPLH